MYMETTKISPERTAGEIQALLAKAGADQIATSYEAGEISGLRWTMKINGRSVPFLLPVRIDPVFKILNGRRRHSYDRSNNAERDHEQARRVAWRQLLRWIQAQLAMIETGMLEPEEPFIPYVEIDYGTTLFTRLRATEFKGLLPAPKGDQ